MKVKLLTLAGLCMMLVALWNQPVRAHCDAGNIHMHGYYYYDIYGGNYWSGCIFEGTRAEGSECINWVYSPETGYTMCTAYNHWVNCDGCF
jgi:hypothetical protein